MAVHVAIDRYVLPGEIEDVSEAMHVLMVQHIVPRVDQHAGTESNPPPIPYYYLT